MGDGERDTERLRLTRRGAVTKARILQAAARLMYVQGVAATTLDDVRSVSGTSKSQLYRYFPDKDALVRDVITVQAEKRLEGQRRHLQRLGSIRGLERWRDAMVQSNALAGGAYGCPLGSLASEVADQDDKARAALAGHFRAWESLLEAGLSRMAESGVLREDADSGRLATGLMAALQGGYLLAQMAHDAEPMRVALDMAIDHVRSYAVMDGTGRTAVHLDQLPAAGRPNS
ncbi:TetR/AcrR family transcriptional regulator [Nonomuraea phyllanthi]|nr:TetR/AcrR family transcriptional regulator [Nonomuraea phyllanthi]